MCNISSIVCVSVEILCKTSKSESYKKNNVVEREIIGSIENKFIVRNVYLAALK